MKRIFAKSGSLALAFTGATVALLSSPSLTGGVIGSAKGEPFWLGITLLLGGLAGVSALQATPPLDELLLGRVERGLQANRVHELSFSADVAALPLKLKRMAADNSYNKATLERVATLYGHARLAELQANNERNPLATLQKEMARYNSGAEREKLIAAGIARSLKQPYER